MESISLALKGRNLQKKNSLSPKAMTLTSVSIHNINFQMSHIIYSIVIQIETHYPLCKGSYLKL